MWVRETREVRRGLEDISSVPAGQRRGHAVAARQRQLGKELDADLLVALLFDKLLELLAADSHVVAQTIGVAKAQGGQFFSSRTCGHAEGYVPCTRKPRAAAVAQCFFITSPYVKNY